MLEEMVSQIRLSRKRVHAERRTIQRHSIQATQVMKATPMILSVFVPCAAQRSAAEL